MARIPHADWVWRWMAVVAIGVAVAAEAQEPFVSFRERVDLPVDAEGDGIPVALDAADFDGDGRTDLVVADNGNGTAVVFLGAGGGTLGLAHTLLVPDGPADIAAADVNVDGSPDIVVASELTDEVSVLLNDGSGNFGASIDTVLNPGGVSGASPVSLTVADFDLDGIPDVATANLFGDSASVLLGNGDGTFTEVDPIVFVPLAGPLGIAAGDLDGDGVPDLAVSLSEPGGEVAPGGEGAVSIHLGVGDGTFKDAGLTVVGFDPAGLVIRDVDGDGRADVVVANQGSDSVSALLGTGDGGFDVVTEVPVGGFPEAVAVADLDGDGALDIVSADSFGTEEFPLGSLSAVPGLGGGDFGQAVAFEVGDAPFDVLSVDLDGNGSLDVITANSGGGSITVLLNLAGGVCVGDCNGNGSVEINELVRGVNIALGSQEIEVCPAFDNDGDERVTVNELVLAVGNSLRGCTG